MKQELRKQYEINPTKDVVQIMEDLSDKIIELDKTFLITEFTFTVEGILTVSGYEK
jgi:hypothetical protein